MTMTETNTNRTGVLKLWLLNFVANAALLAVAYFWLLIPDAHGWQVAATALIAAAVIASVLWLRAGTLAWFRVAEFRKDSGIWRAYRHSLRYVPALAFWVLVFAVVAWLLLGLRDYVPQFAVWIRQQLNGGPPPRNIMNDLNWLLLVIVGYVMPGLWLPIATTVAASGVHPTHIARSRRVWKRPLYWLWLCLLLGVGHLCSIQAGLVDSRPADHAPAGVEHGHAILPGLPHCRHGIHRCGLDDGDLHRSRRSHRTLRRTRLAGRAASIMRRGAAINCQS